MTKRYMILITAIIVLVTAALPHAINMFHFPYYENDEGVYMSQAWSLITQGKLAPYTYWYDHAPAGWIFIALWNILTGGFFTFGFSLNSGRVFMLVLHVAASIFLYLITKKLTQNRLAGILSVIIFSLTPLGIYFQRRVLLDNIMTFWVLLSLALALYCRQKLRYVILSSICFGIAILSKENAIFFAPVLLYVILLAVHPKQKLFALTKWLAIAGSIVGLYFLYALIKNELFPPGSPISGTSEHVSLLATLKEQFSREGGGIIDMQKSSFWQNMFLWISEDALLIYAGVVASLLNLILGIRFKTNRIAGILSASFWLFLIRGGLVIEFYIIPLIPILALNIATAVWSMSQFMKKSWQPVLYLFVGLLIIVSSLYHAATMRNGLNLYISDQTTPQIEAINWILSRNTPTTRYVIDNYGYVDLQSKNKGNFQNAEWYWKVDRDPAVRVEVFSNSPTNIDYLAVTPQMENDISTVGLPVSLTAWHNAKPVVRFWKDGWGVEFWATQYPHRLLISSWESYKKNFIQSGQVIDPNNPQAATSEGQSYALLRAVWSNDKQTFDAVWGWTKNYLQGSDGTFYWKKDISGVQQSSAADADTDIALALLFAHKKWKQNGYLDSAIEVLNGIWDTEVFANGNSYYLGAGNWANQPNEVVINPSYLAPYAYKIFAEADPAHPWMELVDSSYDVLTKCTQSLLDKSRGVLPPEWCSIDKDSGEVRQATESTLRSTEYGYNALRVPFRVALDYIWHKDLRAKKYLSSLSFLGDEYNASGKLTAAYQHDGAVWEEYESVAAYGGNMGYFVVERNGEAEKIYKDKLAAKFYDNEDASYWDDPNNYYSQNWAWFGTALYNKSLPNLWYSK